MTAPVRPVPGKPDAWIVPDPAEHRMGVRLDPEKLRRAEEQERALAFVRVNADAIAPLLLSHYEHALDAADPAMRLPPGGPVQRAVALRKARALRDLLVAIGHESACSVARGERLARLETGAERP